VPESVPVVGSMFYTWKVRVEKHVQKDKKNSRQTELDGGWGVGSGVVLFSVSQTIQGTERHKKTSPPMVGAQNSGNTVYIFCTNLIVLVM
jgi:hypothetical protein